MNTNKHSIYHRAKPAPGVRVHLDRPTIVFITVCTKDRQKWLACDEAHQFLTAVWRKADAWLVGDYVLMPDHLHLFAAARDLRFPIETWIQYWKSQFTKSHNHSAWTWQSSAFHHRLRNDENYSEKWLYVQQNPIRAGLASATNEWPFQGKIHDLRP
jgi:putative transposase